MKCSVLILAAMMDPPMAYQGNSSPARKYARIGRLATADPDAQQHGQGEIDAKEREIECLHVYHVASVA